MLFRFIPLFSQNCCSTRAAGYGVLPLSPAYSRRVQRKETDKRMGELRTAAEALVAASQEAEKPYQAALEHLDALQKEVSQ